MQEAVQQAEEQLRQQCGPYSQLSDAVEQVYRVTVFLSETLRYQGVYGEAVYSKRPNQCTTFTH